MLVHIPVLGNHSEKRQKGEEKYNTGGDASQVSLRREDSNQQNRLITRSLPLMYKRLNIISCTNLGEEGAYHKTQANVAHFVEKEKEKQDERVAEVENGHVVLQLNAEKGHQDGNARQCPDD